MGDRKQRGALNPGVARQEVRRSVAFLATLIMLCVLGAPVVMAWHLGRDPDASFWFGRWGLLAGLVPIILILSHIFHLVHISKNGRSKACIPCSAILSSVLLCIIGFVYMWQAGGTSITLFSEGCNHPAMPEDMLHLQEAYDEAHGIYNTCIQRVLGRHATEMEEDGVGLHRLPTLQTCEEWHMHVGTKRMHKKIKKAPKDEDEDTGAAPTIIGNIVDDEQEEKPWMKYREPRPWYVRWGIMGNGTVRAKKNDPYWRYLASAEANHECGGFCAAGPPLWSVPPEGIQHGQRCGPLVALKLRRVGREGAMVFTSALLGLILFVGMFSAAAGVFERAGFR